MIVRDFAFHADMPDDMRYLRRPDGVQRFIEKDMIFLLPERLKDFRKDLYHVCRINSSDSALYGPLFQVRCVIADGAAVEGFEGPCDVFPFYEKVARNKRHYRDYYVLFLFRHQADYRKYRRLCREPERCRDI
ncbi:hypothetical protein [Gluconacetobacter sp.]|uniref:hypothetical protein n=1 Tax=Gluconacetobacter sp. TaxID=1935994 RepID=UPI0039EC0A09